MTASVADIICELASLQDVWTADTISEATKTSLADALICKVSSIKSPDIAGAGRLLSAIASSRMPITLSEQLQQTISNILRISSDGASKSARSSGSNDTHVLTNLLAYLTANDWEALDEPGVGLQEIIEVLQRRIAKCGVRKLDEQTNKVCMMLIVYIIRRNTRIFPRYSTIYWSYLGSWKRQFATYKTPYPFSVPSKFPQSPFDLDPLHFNHAYETEDPPVSRDLDQFLALAAHIPLRKNSALLVREAHGMVHQDSHNHYNNIAAVTSPVSTLRYNTGICLNGNLDLSVLLGNYNAKSCTRALSKLC